VALVGNSGTPIWLYLAGPPATMLLTALLVYAGFYPYFRDRRQSVRDREERIEATADAVLGREADLSRGRTKVIGLLEASDEQRREIRAISRAVGTVNGSGKTVMTLVHEANDGVRRLGEQLEAHTVDDDRRFRALEGNR
jgi:hypothetical protein